MGEEQAQGQVMNLLDWVKKVVSQFLRVDDLRKEAADLRSQLGALGDLISEQSEDIKNLRELQDKRFLSLGNDLTEVESRMVFRMSQEVEIKQARKAEEAEPESNFGGYVSWSERRRRAEAAASDPTKWQDKLKRAPQI